MALSSKAPHALSGICKTCAARCFGLCGLLDNASASVLAERSHQTSYEQGKEISCQGERAGRIGIIASGLVKVVLLTETGEHHVLQLLKPGQIVGDLCQQENAFSWEAATSAEICWIGRRTLETVMKDHPRIERAYLAVTSRQLEDHRFWTAAMRGRNALERIAFWIAQQVPDGPEGNGVALHIALTRRDLASLLDMTTETLCRGLHQLADRGAISLLAPDEIRVVNTARLRAAARCTETPAGATAPGRDGRAVQDNPFCISQYPLDRRVPALAPLRQKRDSREFRVHLVTTIQDGSPTPSVPDQGSS